MKIPFDIKFKPQIESGEYKVETRSGKTARIVCWDASPYKPIVAYIDGVAPTYFEDGKVEKNHENEIDLFIITPEEELSEFEKKVYAYCDGKTVGEELIKRIAKELLELAKEELEPEVLERLEAAYKNQDEVVYENGRRDGKAEALRTRATELTENLVKLVLDKDSIPYHLIEFMCNLYTCQNWEEIEETAEAYGTRIKSAAMKDLPRWIDDDMPKGSGAIDISGLCGVDFIRRNGKLLRISDIEKLPGFNE